MQSRFDVIVIGGGHAGVEAAWAAANLLAGREGGRSGGGEERRTASVPRVALVTLDPAKIGVMSCNPAIGGLAKGQIVREIDAMGGVMGLAADASGIQFKVLNTSKGPAVHGPRAQCDKHAYARAVQTLIASRPDIAVIGGSVERLVVENGTIAGVIVAGAPGHSLALAAPAVVLTTGTFMRGLMHTGESQTPGGRFGEAAAVGISGALRELGFELGRLKTGTPPRLKQDTIDWENLAPAPGDVRPVPFSDLSGLASLGLLAQVPGAPEAPSLARFPVLRQVECRITHTSAQVHDLIRANLHRAPMYSGQIESVGPRYCPSIEDKVVRFADKPSHQVFLEPESLADDWVYCNGISTSLPADVQERIIRALPGCERAHIYRYGYAVEYDMVPPHQIGAHAMTKRVAGLFLAGQINGTSGYEEAAGQGLVAGINAARFALTEDLLTLGRESSYIGVMMDDLVTKTPTEPYRMFTSRAEHRLLLRADNAAERLTPLAESLGLLDATALGRTRKHLDALRRSHQQSWHAFIDRARTDNGPVRDLIRRPDFGPELLESLIASEPGLHPPARAPGSWLTMVLADRQYEAYVQRQRAEIRRQESMERRRIPAAILDPAHDALDSLRTEARQALRRFRPETFGQAGRLEGVTPADLTLLAVLIRKHQDGPLQGVAIDA
ncbi:MAG TPA: tRNA uridine-5-carboxymethylaminomethyl(34) synthesis enzyme MnmG [Phycisphaerales bacterium]|nr:tRNA uridine-5-carboxymethylaminomethyl(34) synthesis enzyme MnmG [Phycisphaerales bacterium]